MQCRRKILLCGVRMAWNCSDRHSRLNNYAEVHGSPAMSLPNPNVDAKFIVEVQHVKEVTLAAEADLAYWQARLQSARLFPFNQQGKAAFLISATELHSMGRRSNEVTIGLVVCERPTADSPDALYLVQAFNSLRSFAWIERTFFATPYHLGRIQVDEHVPVKVRLEDRAGLILNFHMKAGTAPLVSRDELWQGKIYLPHVTGKYFVAKLGGRTEVYPFLPEADTLQIFARNQYPVFQWLLESNLVGREWRIRSDAVHARSKTFSA
jgi:hypothetical protein